MAHNKYTVEDLATAVEQSTTLSDVLRKLGYTKIAGGSVCHIRDKIKRLDIDMTHFTGQSSTKGRPAYNRKSPEEILIFEQRELRPSGKLLTRALLEIGRDLTCEACGIGATYNNKPLTLQVDHIDSNWSNNLKDNLRFLCPNCHTQTSNFGKTKRR